LDKGTFFASFKPALSWALSIFHFGTSFFGFTFYCILEVIVGAEYPSTLGCLNAAELKAFRFD